MLRGGLSTEVAPARRRLSPRDPRGLERLQQRRSFLSIPRAGASVRAARPAIELALFVSTFLSANRWRIEGRDAMLPSRPQTPTPR